MISFTLELHLQKLMKKKREKSFKKNEFHTVFMLANTLHDKPVHNVYSTFFFSFLISFVSLGSQHTKHWFIIIVRIYVYVLISRTISC